MRQFLTATLVAGALLVPISALLMPIGARADDDCHYRRLEKLLDGGHGIELDDGSQWEIEEIDQATTANWQQDATITACPTQLINTEDHEVAQARLAKRGEFMPEAN